MRVEGITSLRRLRALLGLLICLNTLNAAGMIFLLWSTGPGLGRSIGALPSVLQRVRPAVVTLRVTGEKPVPIELTARPVDDSSVVTHERLKEAVKSGGSGVIIDARNGYILTNNHVVEHATSIDVGIVDGRHFPAVLIGRDPGTDLALLRIEPRDLPSIKIGNSDKSRVGDLVVAVGSPFGLEGTATAGIISAAMRTEIGHEAFEDYFQIDAQINRGNSGGALVNAKGELIGINTVIAGGRGQGYTIGFAIPINMAMTIQDEIKRRGRMQRGFTGLTVKDYVHTADGEAANIHFGAVVDWIMAEAPAAAQGIKHGDVIIEAARKPVRSAAEFLMRASMVPVGSQLPVVLLSEGKRRRVVLTMIARGIEPERHTLRSYLGTISGLVVGEILPGNPNYGVWRGAQILEVPAASASQIAGLAAGDVVIAIDGIRIASVDEMTRRIEQAGLEYKLDIVRGTVPAWIRMKR
jgi:S1-C subfamily serine protease